MFPVVDVANPDDFGHVTYFWRKALAERDDALRKLEAKNKQLEQIAETLMLLNMQTKLLLLVTTNKSAIAESITLLQQRLQALLSTTA